MVSVKGNGLIKWLLFHDHAKNMYQSLKTCFRIKAALWNSQKSTELNKPDQIIALQMLYFSGHLIEINEKRLSIKIKTMPMIWVLCFLAFEKGKSQTQIFKQPWILTQPQLKQISFISNWRSIKYKEVEIGCDPTT